MGEGVYVMTDFPLGFREVVPIQTVPERWKDITLNIGGAQSTLQDIKLPENAGGYCYKDSGRPYTRNRFIYWRVSHDVLELVEASLDFGLVGGHVRYRFQDTPILEGISIHETYSSVVILVATVSSVHRLLFPHPYRIHRQEHVVFQPSEQSIPSIFADASIVSARDPASFHIINNTTANLPLPHTAASWLTAEEDAVFALANALGSILLVKMGIIPGMVTTFELKQASLMSRLLTGLVPGVLRGVEGSNTALSVVLHPLNEDVYVFALCRDNMLRMWSCSQQECVMVTSVLAQMSEAGEKLQHGAQRHILRKAVGRSGQELYLGVFLCFSNQRQFCVFQPIQLSGQYQLLHINTVYAPDYDLIDFVITTTHLWTLWTNSNSETRLHSACIDPESSCASGWSTVMLEEPVDRDFTPSDASMDPRQAYIQYIFHPGRFSVQTISKAISIYRRAVDMSYVADVSIPPHVLKEEVAAVVENEIQTQVTEYEVPDDEYIELTNECWARFCSCCIQYHQAGTKPMGIVVDPQTGFLCLVKKSMFSFLRPTDALEHLLLSKTRGCRAEDFCGTPILCEDEGICADLIGILRAASIICSQLTEEMILGFQQDLYQLHAPDQVAHKLVADLMANSGEEQPWGVDFLPELCEAVQHISAVDPAIHMLLQALSLDLGRAEDLVLEDSAASEASRHLASSRLFCSPVGVSLISESVHQTAKIRFSLCRDLLLLQMLMVESAARFGITKQVADVICSELIPRTVVHTHSYFVLLWITETEASTVQANMLETGLRQMAVLKISEGGSPAGGVFRTALRPLTLVELFLQMEGGTEARMLLAQNRLLDEDPTSVWYIALPSLITIVGQLMWPVSRNFLFPEFLLSSCQYLQIQQYVRLLQTWCEWNSKSRKFLLGSALLNVGEPEKAYDWLVHGAEGVTSDEFLANKLLQSEEADAGRLTVLYYLKIIQLFEQFNLPDFVIDLAKTAINISSADDPDMPTLWYISFSYHLKLGHNDEAYNDMISNPDTSRCKDSLRQFLVTLFERKQLEALVEFPFRDMYDDVENIIESRARSVDLLTTNYYNFLYSFHVFRGNFRKAASVMYEYSMRLGTEVAGIKGLQGQAKCYLACLNALRLVDSAYMWIVKPVPLSRGLRDWEDPPLGVSPKRMLEGDEIPVSTVKRQIEVLEYVDIEKEFELAHAQLRLVKKDPDMINMIGPALSASEVVALLTSSCLYITATSVAQLFGLSVQPVLEGLATACVKISQGLDNGDVWNWLAENEVAALPMSEGGATEQAWRLLEHFLEKYEVRGQSRLHKAIVSRLLSLGAFLPHWIVTSYKKVNAAELLRLFLDHGLLEDAAHLTLEYVDAVLGKGKEHFGLQTALHATAPPVWLPYTALDQLLLELKGRRADPVFKNLEGDVQAKLDIYLQTAAQVSRDMIAASLSRRSS